MGYTDIMLLIFASSIFLEGRNAEEELTVVTREFERIPLHHALSKLEEIVKEEKAIEEFCYKHYDVGRKTKSDNCKEPCDIKPTNCADLYNGGMKSSGVYTIYIQLGFLPIGEFRVYCDMETDGGGWTVIQRRGPFAHQMNFTRNWNAYAHGFGNISEEFWLGNEIIYALTSRDGIVLRIDLEDFQGNRRYALYKGFFVDNSEQRYKLHFGAYSGDAGDSLLYHKGRAFATHDRDNMYNCAKDRLGGWWFENCVDGYLNGEYNNTQGNRGIIWDKWRGSNTLKSAEMKLRTESFDPNRTIKLC